MVKNPDYFKGGYKGDPAISKILFRTIKDANTRAAELMTGAIDWIWDVPKDQAERLQANPALVVENAKTLRVSYLQFDVHGVSGRSSSPTSACARPWRMPSTASRSPRTWSARRPSSSHVALPSRPVRLLADGARKYAYDPAKAKALLKEAGFADGFEFDLFAYRDREYTEAVIGDLAKVGLKPKLTYLQYTAFLESGAQGPHADRARHLGLQLDPRRVGHDGALLPARARRHHQGPGGARS